MKKSVWYLVGVLILAFALVAIACAQPAAKESTPTVERPAAKEPTPTVEKPATSEATSTGKTQAPAAFTVSSLSISPAEVDTGKSVTISVLVTNTGGLTGSYKVTLKIDNVVVATKDVTLAGAANQTVTFTAAKDAAGSHTVSVDGLSGTFTVKTPPTVTPVPAGGTVYQVTIKGFAFSPAQVTIKVGDTVIWTNQDSVAHTATGSGIDSGNLANGQSWSYTFNVAGTFGYKCAIHPSMQGQVTVGGGGASVPAPVTGGSGGTGRDYDY